MGSRTLLSSGLLPLAVLTGWVMPGCGGAATGSSTDPFAGAPAGATSTAPAAAATAVASANPSAAPSAPTVIPSGVLARASTRAGQPIVVEQRDGRRALIIDGAVQGAVRLRDDGALSSADPMLDIVWMRSDRAQKALVIGLGTGQTATQLAAQGVDVEVVESEPQVVELARKHFGFSGKVTVDDGTRFVTGSRKRYDVVIVDAFVGKRTPAALREAATLRALRQRVGPSGLLIFRLLASPSDRAVATLRRSLALRQSFVLADGIADEEQSLYVVGSDGPLETPYRSYAAGRLGGPSPVARPLRMVVPGVEPLAAHPDRGVPVTRVGYLVRIEGQLCLDLAHDGMGAVRFRLIGDAAAPLEATLQRVEAAHRARQRTGRHFDDHGKPVPEEYLFPHLRTSNPFPTNGDIHSDGSTEHTLIELLGGGGVKRSEVHFSPVVVVVQGWAKHAAARSVHRRPGLRRSEGGPRPPSADEELISYGGTLHDLTVSKVHLRYDKAAWDRFRRKIRPLLAQGKAALRASRPDLARPSLSRAIEALDREFGRFASCIAAYRSLAALGHSLDDELATLGGAPGSFEHGAICDRLASRFRYFPNDADGADLWRALRRCAESGYQRASAVKTAPHARIAAARLIHLLSSTAYHDSDGDDFDAQLRRQERRKARAEVVRAAFEGLEPLPDPPPMPGP